MLRVSLGPNAGNHTRSGTPCNAQTGKKATKKGYLGYREPAKLKIGLSCDICYQTLLQTTHK
jgi:hypothetical protein